MASKGRLFHVADGEEGLCWLATRVPAAHRTGDIHADNQLAMRRDAFVKVVDGLWKAPEHALEVATYLDSLKAAKAAAPAAGQIGKLTTLRALQESWQVGFLDAVLKWGQEKFEQIKTYDPESIRHLMAFAVNAAPSLRLSQAAGCKDMDVLRETLHTRMEEVGNRLKLLPAWGPKKDQGGRLPWESCGVYELVWSEGRVVSITHRPSGKSVTLPQVVHVTEEFSLIDNWRETSSRLEMGPIKYGMMSFFPAGTGPHGRPQWKGDCKAFVEAVRSASAVVEQRRAAVHGAAAVAPAADFMAEEHRKRKVEVAERARQALRQKAEDAATRRRVSLRGAAVKAERAEEAAAQA